MHIGRKEVLSVIKRAMDGEDVHIELGEVLSKLDPSDELACHAAHALTHFLQDEDIRARDPEYDEYCRRDLAEYLYKLD